MSERKARAARRDNILSLAAYREQRESGFGGIEPESVLYGKRSIMKVKNGDIWAAENRTPNTMSALQVIGQEKLPVKVSYALAKLGRKLNEHFAILEQVKNDLVKKYGEPDGKGQHNIQQFVVTEVEKDGVKGKEIGPNPKWEEFTADFKELMEQDVEVELTEKIVLPVDGLSVTPATLMALDAFVTVAEK